MKSSLNPTGGFKGVVPFITVLGMLFQIKTVYVFEFSKTLIKLPPLPVSFDLQLYHRATPAIQKLAQDGVIALEEFFKHITGYRPHERDLFASFLEIDSAHATLSPLALVSVQLDEAGAKNVYLSQEVDILAANPAAWDRSSSNAFFTGLLSRFGRAVNRHSFHGTDLEVYKPGNVAERIVTFTENGRVHVCCIYLSHDEYERDLPKTAQIPVHDRLLHSMVAAEIHRRDGVGL